MGDNPQPKPYLLLEQFSKNIEQIAANTAAIEGYQLVGFNFIEKIKPMTIQVQICLEGGGDVSLDDCSHLSKPIAEAIEKSKLIGIPYVLEISSPGLNDILKTDKEFETFKGFPIEVSKKDETNSQVIESGLLHTRSKEHLLINVKGKISKIPRNQVMQVRLVSPTS